MDGGSSGEIAARRRLFDLKKTIGSSWAMLAAIVALLSAGIALLFQVRPDLLPDPRTHLGASASVFSIDTGVSLDGYLIRRSAITSVSEYTKERLAYTQTAQRAGFAGDGASVLRTPGEDVFVNLRVEGFKSRSIAMLASMYDSKTRHRVHGVTDWPVFEEQLNSPSDQSVVEFWLPAPPVNVQRYFVRVEVYHRGDGVLLAVTDSKSVVAG